MIQTEARERFIFDLVTQLGGVEIIEVHCFSPRRVSGVERGVAVIAARLPELEAVEPGPGEMASPAAAYAPPPVVTAAAPERYTVYTATYRHTLKGPERGKWEVSVKAEAEAPLVTVDQVVRGVQRRAEDTAEVERLTGDEIRAIVDVRPSPAG
ncbi:MAG: hypothetical protein ACRENQ_16230 [Gemmatimonadaceae bacterium]